MVAENTNKNKTPFTVSIEARLGTTTGVSAADRIQTIKTAISPTCEPEDLVRPGHVFPLIAKKNGVFDRRGHTEGSVDLVKLAGLGESAVLCELMNPDGSMAKLEQIIDFGMKHDMIVVTIEDIVKYRLQLDLKNN
jgi:3,4-dihydroxy 2-butanone 4-phosphate synthase